MAFCLLALASGGPSSETLAWEPACEPGPAPQDWEWVEDLHDGVRLFRRPRAATGGGAAPADGSAPGPSIPEAQARICVSVSVDRVLAAITDYDNLASFIPYLDHSRTLRVEGATRWVHQRLDLPPPLSMREYVIAVRSARQAEGWVVSWSLADWPLESSAVRPRALEGSWVLIPREQPGRGPATEVIYTVYMDPGGTLPGWLLRMGLNSYLPSVVRSILEQAGAALPEIPPPREDIY